MSIRLEGKIILRKNITMIWILISWDNFPVAIFQWNKKKKIPWNEENIFSSTQQRVAHFHLFEFSYVAAKRCWIASRCLMLQRNDINSGFCSSAQCFTDALRQRKASEVARKQNIFHAYVNIGRGWKASERLVENELWNELVGDLFTIFLVPS
jgi:hypothetical protein